MHRWVWHERDPSDDVDHCHYLAATFFGLLTIVVAFMASYLRSIVQASIATGGSFSGAVGGLFFLGVLFPWCGGRVSTASNASLFDRDSDEGASLRGDVFGIHCDKSRLRALIETRRFRRLSRRLSSGRLFHYGSQSVRFSSRNRRSILSSRR